MTRLVLRAAPPHRIDVSSLRPDRLAGLTHTEIERLPLRCGNQGGRVGDWFAVTADGSDDLCLAGPTSRIDRIGAGLAAGTIRVDGDAGAFVGEAMIGGRIDIAGSAAFGAATAMAGGHLAIGGKAGDGLGGALPGESAGMSGGVVVVAGDAGARAGERLRRGLIVIRGQAGIRCGARMRAGTIVVGGPVDRLAGRFMRRGSLLALGGAAPLGIGFADGGVHDLVALRLIARELRAIGEPALAERIHAMRRWSGDRTNDGRGEIWTP